MIVNYYKGPELMVLVLVLSLEVLVLFTSLAIVITSCASATLDGLNTFLIPCQNNSQ